jgi:predicted metal-dependent phosphotriesterase family hydrolase
MILATSHLSHEETFALVRAAKEHRVEHIIITHVDFPTTFYTVEEQMELLRCGAYMEHCFVTYNSGKVDFEVVLEQIRAIGASHIILSTDLGQKTGIYPDEGLEQFVTSLYDRGISEGDIKKMTSHNQRVLLGKV